MPNGMYGGVRGERNLPYSIKNDFYFGLAFLTGRILATLLLVSYVVGIIFPLDMMLMMTNRPYEIAEPYP